MGVKDTVRAVADAAAPTPKARKFTELEEQPDGDMLKAIELQEVGEEAAADAAPAPGRGVEVSRKSKKSKKLRTKEDELSGTVRTMINSFISFVGAGILGLPFAFSKGGWLLASIGIISVGLLCLYCMLLITRCKRVLLSERPDVKLRGGKAKHPENIASLGDLGYQLFGTTGRLSVDLCIMLSQVCFCIGYLIFISKTVSHMVKIEPPLQPPVVVAGLLPPLFVLCNIRHLKFLAPFSMVANCCNIFSLLVCTFYAAPNFAGGNGPPVAEARQENILFILGVSVYCYEGIGMVLPVEANMAKKDDFNRIWSLNLLIVSLLYWGFGLTGYLAYGDDTHDIIIMNLPQNSLTSFTRVCLSLALLLTYPIMMFPVSQALDGYVFRGSPADAHFWPKTVLRMMLVCASGVVAASVTQFGVFMSLIGASVCSMLGFIMPCVFHLKLCHASMWLPEKLLNVFILLFGVCFAVVGTLQALEDMSEGEGGEGHGVV